jgi:hypothetical protein
MPQWKILIALRQHFVLFVLGRIFQDRRIRDLRVQGMPERLLFQREKFRDLHGLLGWFLSKRRKIFELFSVFARRIARPAWPAHVPCV